METNFITELSGVISGQSIRVAGQGSLNEVNGLTSGDYQLIELPLGFNPEILGIMKVTGYPNASRSIQHAFNPFKGHSYSYQRRIHFGEEQMNLLARVDLTPSGLESKFLLTGSYPKDLDLGSLQPITEEWTQPNCSEIGGRFDAVWITQLGHKVKATTYSRYWIDTVKSLDAQSHRVMRLDTKVSGGTFSLVQQVDLFDGPAPADSQRL